jgi:spore maturation protein CgeB
LKPPLEEPRVKLVIFGLSITSAWGNGHATTFRALVRELAARGHRVVFFEKDVLWYRENRDLPRPDYCELVLYDDWQRVAPRARAELRDADVAMVGSYFPDGHAAIDTVTASPVPIKTFYDIDTPVTLANLRTEGKTDYLRADQVPLFDVYFSFTGGPMLRELERRFGARRAVPLYCSFDPERYHRRPTKRYQCDLSYMGTYARDRQPKLDAMLLEPARLLPARRFIVAGPQYPKAIAWPANVRRITHLNPRWHSHLYSSSRLTLNVTRAEMVEAGWSPSVRLFEAAACAATIVSDRWPGLDSFFTPGEEILLARDGDEVVGYLSGCTDAELRRIGEAARQRVMDAHTAARRADELEAAVNAVGRAPLPAIAS